MDCVRIKLNCKTPSYCPENCVFSVRNLTHTYILGLVPQCQECWIFLSVVLLAWKKFLPHIWATKLCIRCILFIMSNLLYFYWYFVCMFCVFLIEVCWNQSIWWFPFLPFFPLSSYFCCFFLYVFWNHAIKCQMFRIDGLNLSTL